MSSGEVQSSVFSDYRRDYYGGALMTLIGIGAIVQGVEYRVGTLTRMGSGFFAVALGAIMILLGLMIAGTAKRMPSRATTHEGVAHQKSGPEWRGWICILASVALFPIIGKWGGLLPATFAIVFISALGDRDNTIKSALILAVSLSIVAVVVFWWALQVQFPLFNWG